MCRGTYCRPGDRCSFQSPPVAVAMVAANERSHPAPMSKSTTETTASTATTSSTTSTSSILNNNTNNNNNNQRKSAFLTRSLATRTISFIEAELERSTCESSFLKSHPPRSSIAKLERNELVLGDLLGRGGFSEVYSVESVCQQLQVRNSFPASTNRRYTASQYAVKHLRKDLASSHEKRSTFHSAAADLILEAQFLSRMDHPNIIKLRGWAAGGTSCFGNGSHDSYFLILDRLETTLAERIEEWKREQEQQQKDSWDAIHDMDEKLNIATQLASALEYLHERRIVYRDLKVDNIGLTNGKSTVQLFDFGLARELPPCSENEKMEDEIFHMSGVGTRRYCAPEVVLGEGYNLQVDVYSLTLVIYEMLTRIKAFEVIGPESHRVLVAEGGLRPTLPIAWPAALQDLMERGWAAKPSHRPIMKQFRQGLERIKEANDQTNEKSTSWLLSPLLVLPEMIRTLSGTEGYSFGTSSTENLSTYDSFDSE